MTYYLGDGEEWTHMTASHQHEHNHTALSHSHKAH